MLELPVVDSSGNTVGAAHLNLTEVILIAVACMALATIVGVVIYKRRV